MKNLLKKVRFKLVSLLIQDESDRGVENFYKNSAKYWCKKYENFIKGGDTMVKYYDSEIKRLKKERNEIENKFIELESKYKMMMKV